ncbi:hypothetical protein [Kutzneria sp. 744]|uniref:hypothetical protein n=1 Tax=Kutzneria sp. (strain 744) TaxID=345341 RepID=UPI0004B3AA87|nr:hypothetical protein [Kutzneria sp. 744]
MTTADELVRAGIRPVKRRVEVDLLSCRGVVGVDIGEKITGGRRTGQVGIVVYVRRKHSAVRPADLVPAEIEGIATDVVADDVVLHRALLDAEFPPARGAERHRQVLGGISMGPWRTVLLSPPEAPRPGEYAIVGTLGAGTDRTGNGQVMGLTTFHAACVDDPGRSATRWCIRPVWTVVPVLVTRSVHCVAQRFPAPSTARPCC